MLLTIAMIILLIGLFIDGYLNYNQQKTIENLAERINHLEKQSTSIDKLHYDAIYDINRDMESFRTMFYDLKNVRNQSFNQDFLTRLSNTEQTINNVISDLDRSIGVIDQVQHRIEEMEVLLRNSINELREGNE